MKLTNYTRDAFIDSVMNDVPRIDYAAQARKIALAAIVAAQPKQVQTMWASNELRPYLQVNTMSLCNEAFAYPSPDRYTNGSVPASAKAEVDGIVAAHQAHKNARADLRTKLRSAAYACNTTKALRELLPEFDRYLPPEEEKTSRQLPVVQNIMADFVKAGWPKKQSKKATA